MDGEAAGGRALLELRWMESDVPIPPGEPSRGVGCELIEDYLPDEPDAVTRLQFRAVGVCCSLEIELPSPTPRRERPRSGARLGPDA